MRERRNAPKYLIAEGVTTDDDGLRPSGHETGDVLADDRLAKHRPAKDVSNRAVWTQPHLLQFEFLHPERRDSLV